MRIAMIGHKRIPSREGGIEIVVEELAVRMCNRGHTVTVYNRSGSHVAGIEDSNESRKPRNYKGVRLKWVPTFQAKSLNAIVYAVLASFHAVFSRYDVLHYHAEGPCAMIWLPKLFGKKVVTTIHGLDWQRAKWGGFATRFLLFGEKMAAKYADTIIVLSKNVQNYFLETYQRETVYVPNGVIIPQRKEADLIHTKYGLTNNTYLLFLARIVPEKGLHYLIEAYLQAGIDKKLVIAGGSSHSDDYLESIKERVKGSDTIIMTGFVQGQELEELYSNCYLYVLPSDIEGMPLSLLEAMSYGKKCLVSDIEENLEVAGGFCESFEKGNVEDLKNKLIKVCEEENEKKDREEEIIASVRDRYDWEKVTSETLELYRGI